MKLIAAVDENWAIGYENELLFRIPPDLKRFRALTEGNIVVMGRKTLATFPKAAPLPNRENIVLSRDTSLQIAGATVCHSLEELGALLKEKEDGRDVFVIGGAEIYALLMPYCTGAEITHVRAAARADCYFPNLTRAVGWERVSMTAWQAHEGLHFAYAQYQNHNLAAL